MSFDTTPGQPYSPKFRVLDSNGSPVLSGVTGTISVYPPTSATTPVLNGATLVHKGDGFWGHADSILFTALGDYTWTTSALSGGVTWGAQSGLFTVGRGDWWSMRDLLVSVRRGLRDGWTGTTDAAGTTTTLKASAFAYGSANDWVSSEILILEPVTLTDTNPVRVTGFVVSAGTFTFTPAVTGIASTAVGIDFIIGNKDGEGFSHDEVWDALTGAVRRLRAARPTSDQVLIATVPLTYEYAVPAGWSRVDRVSYQPQGGATTLWVPLDRPYWRFRADRGLLALDSFPANCALRIEGRATPRLPERLADLAPGDGAAIRDDALYELLSLSDDQGDRQRAAMMGPGVMHARAGAALGRL